MFIRYGSFKYYFRAHAVSKCVIPKKSAMPEGHLVVTRNKDKHPKKRGGIVQSDDREDM